MHNGKDTVPTERQRPTTVCRLKSMLVLSLQPGTTYS